jgi:hypothetical protein
MDLAFFRVLHNSDRTCAREMRSISHVGPKPMSEGPFAKRSGENTDSPSWRRTVALETKPGNGEARVNRAFWAMYGAPNLAEEWRCAEILDESARMPVTCRGRAIDSHNGRKNMSGENSSSAILQQVDDAASPQTGPAYTLFDSTSVGLATFFGTPMAGAGLMALNYRRMGKRSGAIAAFVVGLAMTGLAILLGARISPGVSTAAGIGLLVATIRTAKALQGAAVDEHLRQRGQLGSRWTAIGLGVAVLAIICGGVFLAAFVLQSGSKVVIGSRDAIYYSGSAKNEDGRSLGEALKKIGFLSDKGNTVLLSKGKDGTVVSFVVEEPAWTQPEMAFVFEEIVREVAPSVGGYPIKLRLLNSTRQAMKELTVGKVIIGTTDEVFYLGLATQSEAVALGQLLKSAGFFTDQGALVFLSKGDDGTAISFVVTDGMWDQPDHLAVFEDFIRQSAPSVGGLPIKLLLRDTTLQAKKIVTVS